jgi:exopolyphosphatase/guanosine-5'-triphosphate,3'-diphosphate pyrophosphatase
VTTDLAPARPAGSRRVAAIDCGTNSIRLLIADLHHDGASLTEVDRRVQIVRLGQGVDQTGRLASDALDRTFAATRDFAAAIEAVGGVERIRFVATSATRDAENRDAFFDGIDSILGVTPEVVSGDEEAALSFRGATGGVSIGHEAPYLVVDLGGGSTELVLGTDAPHAAFSMNVGSVRLTERHLHSDPPTDAEIAAASDDVAAALDEALAVVPVGQAATIIGLAGSVTSLTAFSLGLSSYDRSRVDGATFTPAQVRAFCDDMLHMSRDQRRALGFMQPGRIDVIGAGALIWAEVVSRVEAQVAATGRTLTTVTTSEHDILDGIALSMGG